MKIFVIGGVVGPPPDEARQINVLDRTMQSIGAEIVRAGHDLVVCSPDPRSADVSALRGAAAAVNLGRSVVDFHYPDQENIARSVEQLRQELPIKINPYPTKVPLEAGEVQKPFGWLLPQLNAMDRSHVTIGLGGRSATLLFDVAQSRRKIVLPLAFLGGAAAAHFSRVSTNSRIG